MSTLVQGRRAASEGNARVILSRLGDFCTTFARRRAFEARLALSPENEGV